MLKLLFSALFALGLVTGSAIAAKPTPQELDKTILLTENNHVLLRGPVTDESVSKVMSDLAEQIDKRRNTNYTIYLVLDTPGGSVDAGFRLYEFARNYPNIVTITLDSYSMGAVLAEILPGPRYMVETGVLMFHPISVALPRSQHLDQVDSIIKLFHVTEEMILSKVSARVGIEKEQLRSMVSKDLYLGAEEALQKNFIDKIVQVRCSAPLLKKQSTEIIPGGGLFPDIPVQTSACPLM